MQWGRYKAREHDKCTIQLRGDTPFNVADDALIYYQSTTMEKAKVGHSAQVLLELADLVSKGCAEAEFIPAANAVWACFVHEKVQQNCQHSDKGL